MSDLMVIPPLDDDELDQYGERLGTLDDATYYELRLVVERLPDGRRLLRGPRAVWDRSHEARLMGAEAQIRYLEQQLETLRDQVAKPIALTLHAPPAEEVAPAQPSTPSPRSNALLGCLYCHRSFRSKHGRAVHLAKCPERPGAKREAETPPAEPDPAPQEWPRACHICGMELVNAIAALNHAQIHAGSKLKHAPRIGACPWCGRDDFKAEAGRTKHITSCRRARNLPTSPAPPPEALAQLLDDTIEFRCATCGSGAFARDLHKPSICVRCAKAGRAAA